MSPEDQIHAARELLRLAVAQLPSGDEQRWEAIKAYNAAGRAWRLTAAEPCADHLYDACCGNCREVAERAPCGGPGHQGRLAEDCMECAEASA